jgi:hypothetical protein
MAVIGVLDVGGGRPDDKNNIRIVPVGDRLTQVHKYFIDNHLVQGGRGPLSSDLIEEIAERMSVRYLGPELDI